MWHLINYDLTSNNGSLGYNQEGTNKQINKNTRPI